MQFGDITRAINDAWLFIWPPFVMVIIAYLCSKSLSKYGTNKALIVLWNMVKATATHFESIKKVMEVYGLSKLIPLISLVFVISILYLLQGPVTTICSKLPPHIYIRPSIIIERGNKDDLLLLLRKYPTADSIGDAYGLAEDTLHSSEKYMETRYDRLYIHVRIQQFIKFGWFCLLILFIIHWLHGESFFLLVRRLLVSFSLLAIIWSIALIPYLYNQEQSIYDDWRKIRISLQVEADQLLKDPTTNEEERKLRVGDHIKIWWEIKVFDSYIIEWSMRNILGRSM